MQADKTNQTNPMNQNKRYLIEGPSGKLEVALDWPKNQADITKAVIICHPHPLYQGTMDNKVVTTISRSFNQLGLLVVRFNYRGVGKSEGTYDESVGEVDDLLAVISWLRNQNYAEKISLAGFSFGGAIAYKAATRVDQVEHLLMIAPSVVNFNLKGEPEPKAPLFIILSDDDEIIPKKDTLLWLTSEFNGPFHLTQFVNAGHFFHGRLVELKEEIINHYAPYMTSKHN